MDLEIIILSEVSDITYMWNLKKKKKIQMNLFTKQKQTHRYRKQTSGYQWGGGRGNVGVGEQEVQTFGCKIGSRMYCTTQRIQPIFCSNCKWKVTFKNCIKIEKGFLIKKSFMHVACQSISFRFEAVQYSIVCIYHFLFVHSSTNGRLCCFHTSVIFL